MAYYRWLNNEAVSLSGLTDCLAQHCSGAVKGRHVLAVNDSSEVNLQAHAGRLNSDGVGLVGNDKDLGFFVHPTLALEAQTGLPLGLSSVQLWTRPPKRLRKTKQTRKRLPIEEKESYKWIEAAQRSHPCFESGGALHVTYVGDSESDVYECWSRIVQHSQNLQVDLLVRACRNRCLSNSALYLYDYLAEQPIRGQYQLTVLADPHRQRLEREATLSVRFVQLNLKRPARVKSSYPSDAKVWAVEVIELNPPEDQKPIHWRLLTSHRVESYEQALQIVEWYRYRWHIEQLFAILKSRALDIESSQQESGVAIQKLCLLALSVAVQVLQLTLGRKATHASVELAFDAQQQRCLEQLATTLNGKTLKQSNPYPSESLAWAAWLIARLGGWAGFQSQRPPGVFTFFRGLRKFDDIFLGWKMTLP